MKFQRLFLLPLLLLTVLSACQSLGLQEPKSLDQRIAYGYGVQAAVNDAAASALTANTIKKSDAEYVLKTSLEARALLDAARTALGGGDTKTAEGRLVLATNILVTLQTYLRSNK